MIIFNREKEKNELLSKIRDNEYIFVNGESGVGKSSLIRFLLEKNFSEFISFSFKEREKGEEFFEFIYIIYEILHEKYFIKNIKAVSRQFGTVELEKIYKNYEIIKKIKDSFLSTNYKILINKDYSTFFNNFWKALEDKNIKIIWFSNIEFLKESEIEFLKAFIFSKENQIKIIFEKGNLLNNNVDLKLKNLIVNRNIVNYTLKPFDEDHTRLFCKYLEKEYSDEVYSFSNGIPLAIEYEKSLKKIVEYDYSLDEENFLILLVIMFEFVDDCNYINYLMQKLNIHNIDLNNDKFEFIIFNEQKIKLNHYYIYFLLKKKFLTKINQMIEQLEFMKKAKKKVYFATLAKFYPMKLLEEEIDDFIDFLMKEIEKFNILELKKYLSFKIDTDDETIYLEILRLIQLQIDIYFFNDKKIDFLNFYDNSIKLIGFIIKLQYLYHQDRFKEVIHLIENEFNQYFINSSNDEEFLSYINITISALKSATFLALGKYTDAKSILINTIRIIENKKIHTNLNDYILNLLPAVEFTDALNNQDFINYQSIENLYIRFKRHHNILALKLYDYQAVEQYSNILENDLSELIKDFISIASVEKSYTINNLLVFYIITNNLQKAQEIIFDIEYKYFERYDRISLYNNAIIYFILSKNYQKSKEFSDKALKIIDEGFSDPSFVSKIYLNSAILYKLNNENSYIEFLNKIVQILPKDYDGFYLLQRKIDFIKQNKLNSFILDKKSNKTLERFIFWPQIIHFWDFDIPLLNKDIINYFLKKN